MKFSDAKWERCRIIYTHDDDLEQKEYLRIFNTHKMLHIWMDQNPDKTIRRMSIMYSYPNVS